MVDYNKIGCQKEPDSTGSPKSKAGKGPEGNGRIRKSLAIGCGVLACLTAYSHFSDANVVNEQTAEKENSLALDALKEVLISQEELIAQLDAQEPVKSEPQFFFNNNLSPAPLPAVEVPFDEVEKIDDFLPAPGLVADTPLKSPIPLTAAESELANDYSQEPSQILIEVEKGDTLSGLLAKQDLSSAEIAEITALPEVQKYLTKLRPGQEIKVDLDGARNLTKITRDVSLTEQLIVARETDNKFVANLKIEPLEKTVHLAELTLESSLFNDGEKAGLSESMIMELYSIFQWTVDFNREVRTGDRLTLLHETFYKDGRKIKDGKILAAEYQSARNLHTAYRHASNGQTGYYDSKGRSLEKQFLRNPVKARITSPFNPKRKHPILHVIRAHKGVDYGAPIGTAVASVGAGTVSFAGVRGSFGNMIEIQHGDKHSTLYAHLDRLAPKMKQGQKVSQGQVIGYVGQTGAATGPHLHYEFRINGVHHDPQKVALGGSVPLAPEQLAKFKTQIQPLREQLASVRQNGDTLAMR
ncbi:hypothetical protein AB833_00325 [Chromatiales bacterium (ex Bugula neritina AB1)]|nr:hypothetical protein AB833_00325 [Chromatiales bacterium (ex Bugula neritina AB1)]